MDRLAPTRRPVGRPVGTQQWRSLLFLHWQVDPEQVRRLLPAGLEIDLLHGRAYVGVVPFHMQAVRPWTWWPRRLGFRFPETNVRLYVRCGDEPGVYFLSLDAASRLAVTAARRMWSLPYHFADMSIEEIGDRVHYQTVRKRDGGSLGVDYRIGESLRPSVEGSPEFFFLERYLLFVERRERLWRGQVHHAPYPAHRVKIDRLEDQLAAAAGLECAGPPDFAHYSPGVDVEIFPLRPLD